MPAGFLHLFVEGAVDWGAKEAIKYGGNIAGLFLSGVPLPLGDIGVAIWDHIQKEIKTEAHWKAVRDDLARVALREFRDLKQETTRLIRLQQASQTLSEQDKEVMASYLAQLPDTIHRQMRRPGDGTGHTIPPSLKLTKDDVISFLPLRPPRFAKGDQPLDGWELVEQLGAGGFGEVWKARSTRDQWADPLVFKFCLDEVTKKFLRNEAGVIRQLQNSLGKDRPEGIVRLMNDVLNANPPFLIYEYVDGCDLKGLLKEWLATERGPELWQVMRVIRRIAGIVAIAHKHGIVHRDLKPANILVRRDDEKEIFKITDFGIGGAAIKQAIVQAESKNIGPPNTEQAAILGAHTEIYASPQQMAGNNPDCRDDVYSLGVIWYQLLAQDFTCKVKNEWRNQVEGIGLPSDLITLLERSIYEDRPEKRPENASVLCSELDKSLNADGSRTYSLGAGVGLAVSVIQGLCDNLKKVEPGSFMMGAPESERGSGVKSDEEQHEVEITRSIRIGIRPVTQAEYKLIMGDNPSYFTPDGRAKKKLAMLNHLELPVERVSWKDANLFCRRLSDHLLAKRMGLRFRLPTEAEWEYACRTGEPGPYAFGSELTPEQANFGQAGSFLGRTSPAGSYDANRWELFDMHGNVWEWCNDYYQFDYYSRGPRSDPTGPDSVVGGMRVVRGGAWDSPANDCRSAKRHKFKEQAVESTIGFRVVAEKIR